jgi:hypothetical protein
VISFDTNILFAAVERSNKDHVIARSFLDSLRTRLLIEQGVTDFATVNTKDFEGIGFARVWNPLAATAR